MLKKALLLLFPLVCFMQTHAGEIRTKKVVLNAEELMQNNGLIFGSESVSLNVGELSGTGQIVSPKISISAKKFNFKGFIWCTQECVIKSQEPFDPTMFIRFGSGTFTIETIGQLAAASKKSDQKKED